MNWNPFTSMLTAEEGGVNGLCVSKWMKVSVCHRATKYSVCVFKWILLCVCDRNRVGYLRVCLSGSLSGSFCVCVCSSGSFCVCDRNSSVRELFVSKKIWEIANSNKIICLSEKKTDRGRLQFHFTVSFQCWCSRGKVKLQAIKTWRNFCKGLFVVLCVMEGYWNVTWFL